MSFTPKTREEEEEAANVLPATEKQEQKEQQKEKGEANGEDQEQEQEEEKQTPPPDLRDSMASFGPIKAIPFQDRVFVMDTTSGDEALMSELAVLKAHTQSVVAVAISPNSAFVASCSTGDQTVVLWDPDTGRPKSTLRCNRDGKPQSMCFSNDSRTLAVGLFTGTVIFFDTVSKDRKHDVIKGQLPAAIGCLTFSPSPPASQSLAASASASASSGSSSTTSTNLLAVGNAGGIVNFYDFGMTTSRIPGGHKPNFSYDTQTRSWISNVIFSPRGKTLFVACLDSVRIYDLPMKQSIGDPLVQGGGQIFSISLATNGRTLAVATLEGMRLFSVGERKQIGDVITPGRFCQKHQRISFVAISPDSKTVAFGDKTVTLFDLGALDEKLCPPGFPTTSASSSSPTSSPTKKPGATSKPLFHLDHITSAKWSVCGRSLITASEDKTLKIIDVLAGTSLVSAPFQCEAPVSSLEFAELGSPLAAVDTYGKRKHFPLKFPPHMKPWIELKQQLLDALKRAQEAEALAKENGEKLAEALEKLKEAEDKLKEAELCERKKLELQKENEELKSKILLLEKEQGCCAGCVVQ